MANLRPLTRQRIVLFIGFIGLACVVGEIILLAMGKQPSDGLTTIAAAAVGALGGALLPDDDDGRGQP